MCCAIIPVEAHYPKFGICLFAQDSTMDCPDLDVATAVSTWVCDAKWEYQTEFATNGMPLVPTSVNLKTELWTLILRDYYLHLVNCNNIINQTVQSAIKMSDKWI